MTGEQAAYLAGIIDGEGTITLLRHPYHKRKTFQFRPVIHVSNTSVELIKVLEFRHGGKTTSETKRGMGNKRSFKWRVYQADAIHEILTSCLPHLVIKKKHAELLIDFINTRRLAGARAAYSSKESVIWEKVKTLNGGKQRRSVEVAVALENGFLHCVNDRPKGQTPFRLIPASSL